MEKKKIVHIITGDLWAGAEAVTFELLAELVKAESVDLQVVVLNEGVVAERIRELFARLQTTPARRSCELWQGGDRRPQTKKSSEKNNKNKFPVSDFQSRVTILSENVPLFQQFSNIAKAIKEINPDIIHTHKPKEDYLALYAKVCSHRASVKLVRTVHGLTEKRRGWKWFKSGIQNLIDILILKFIFSKIVCVSQHIADTYKRWGISEKKIEVIRNAIDVEKFKGWRKTADNTCLPARQGQETVDHCQPVASNEKSLRSEVCGLQSQADEFLIGSAGRLTSVKGYDKFLKMAAEIVKTHPNTKFVLFGDGPERDVLERLAGDLVISDRVLFAGHRDDIYECIAALDLFVISSHSEGIPSVILECGLLNVPIVSTNVGGISEVIEDGKSGLLVAPNDPSILAQACVQMMNDNELRSKCIENLRKKIENDHDVKIASSKLIELYKSISVTTDEHREKKEGKSTN